jgi:hypothetical protein
LTERVRCQQGINDAETFVTYTVLKIFGVERLAAQAEGGGDDGGVPVGKLKAAAEREPLRK